MQVGSGGRDLHLQQSSLVPAQQQVSAEASGFAHKSLRCQGVVQLLSSRVAAEWAICRWAAGAGVFTCIKALGYLHNIRCLLRPAVLRTNHFVARGLLSS
jgi:hypothetical protein